MLAAARCAINLQVRKPRLIATMVTKIPKPNTEPPSGMVVFKNINSIAAESPEFRRVLFTGRNSQTVLMTIPVGGDIGEEIHAVDQSLTFLSGTAKAVINGETAEVTTNDLVIVPAGAKHQFYNIGKTPLILYTTYSPAEHKADTVHKTKEEGEKLEDGGKDEAPEWAKELHKKDPNIKEE